MADRLAKEIDILDHKAPAIVLSLFLVLGCSSNESPDTQPDPETALPQVEASDELPRSVHWMRNSAEYRAVLRQTYSVAGHELRQAVETKQPGTWAVALDADETVISNSLYEKELRNSGRENNSENWHAWVIRQEAPPLPGAIEFLHLIRDLGGYIAIVTNRSAVDCPDTELNFQAFEIPYDVMLCKTDDGEKEPRWEMVEKGTASESMPPVEIVMWLGDNIKDFPNHDQTLRFGEQSLYVDYGTRYFIMPNPMYGSWQVNPHD